MGRRIEREDAGGGKPDGRTATGRPGRILATDETIAAHDRDRRVIRGVAAPVCGYGRSVDCQLPSGPRTLLAGWGDRASGAGPPSVLPDQFGRESTRVLLRAAMDPGTRRFL